VVTSAAAVMVSVFAIFATLGMLEMKMMGVGLAAAILLDATVIRLVLLPAVLVLLGERAWWPRRPARPAGEQVIESDPAYELVG
jgi:RND superfamily putative drug exporter